MGYDFKSVEKKWQDKWEEAGAFHAQDCCDFGELTMSIVNFLAKSFIYLSFRFILKPAVIDCPFV